MSRSVVLYARVSSDRQSGNTSVPDQLAMIRAWASRLGYDVAAEFVDDGESARVRPDLTESFDSRPGWTELRRYLREHPARRGGPSLVAFKDYKRFSRDSTAAHVTIQQLRRIGVEVQAIEQPIDWSVPAQRYLVGIYLADGEVDNEQRASAVRRGMAATAASGRYTFAAPLGYRATYDGRKRLGIEPDPETAPVILRAFELAADPNRPLTEVAAWVQERIGRRAITGMTAFKKMLQRRTYIGDVPVPAAARAQLGDWVPGVHAPIVGPALWERVQERLSDRRVYARRRAVHPELYLRGLVHDDDVTLTGSGVRSKSGARVWYYHGQGRGALRVRADVVHDGVLNWLDEHEPDPCWIDLVRACVADELRQATSDAERERRTALRDLETAERRLERATDALVEGRIEQDAYQLLAGRARAEMDRSRALHDSASNGLQGGAGGSLGILDRALELVTSAASLYRAADVVGRRELVSSIMPSGVGVAHQGGVIELRPSPLAALVFGVPGTVEAETQSGRPAWDGRNDLEYARDDSNTRPSHP